MDTETINISISKTKQSRISDANFEELQFGQIKSDHMLVAEYSNGAWHKVEIKPYGNLEISPACIGLHYGQSIFEGLKAFKTSSGEVAMFRPQENMKRLQRSAQRLMMPPISEEIFMEGLKALIDLDRNWVPDGDDQSLYIRPYQFGNEPNIGVHASLTSLFIIFTCPAGKYYSKGVDVYLEDQYIRAARGGSGSAKAAGNYAPTLLPVEKVKEKGYDQILWSQLIDGKRYVQEIGTMNFFVQIDDQLITPELDGTILEGITRDSILTIAHDEGIKVEERMLSVDELFEAAQMGRVKDAFGTGTAAVITNIAAIGRNNEKIQLPPISDRKLSHFFKQRLTDIRNGDFEDKFHWMVKV